MDPAMKAILEAPEKKSFWQKLGSFMLYGGWMLVIFLVLILVMVFSHK